MADFINARVIQKIATVSEWSTSTIIPYKGEIMLVSDGTGKVVNIKVGDGINHFNDLPYMFENMSNFNVSDAGDVSVAGRTDGQVLSWNADINKWVARNEQSLAGYATQAWVMSIGFLTEDDADLLYKPINWFPEWDEITDKPTTLAGFGITDVYTKSESDARYLDTLQSVTNRGNSTSLDISVRGVQLTDFLGLPTTPPDPSDVLSGSGYIWLGDGAEAGVPNAGTLAGLEDVSLSSLTNGQSLVWNASTMKWENATISTGGGTWGSITGVLSNQTDLMTALNGKANIVHTHPWAQITDKPTTISGYGITDAYTKSEVNNAFVPYTGANKAINFNTQNLTLGGYTNKLSTYFERINLASDSTDVASGNFKLLTNVAAAGIGNVFSQTSDIIISLPITTTTLWQAEIDILREGYRTTLNIGGYGTNNENIFVNVVYGDINDIIEVKFGRIENSTVLIIKRSNSTIRRLQVNISKFYYHHSNSTDLYDDKTKYKVEYIDESELVGFTLNGVITNSQFKRDSYLWNKGNFTQTNVDNWNTAFGWGNHALAGYAVNGTGGTHVRNNTQLDARYMQVTAPANSITTGDITNWNTAYSQSHTHANKAFLDTVNQNMGTSNTVTFDGIIATTRLRIPTSAPSSPVDGEIWIDTSS